jgi:SlyX protein
MTPPTHNPPQNERQLEQRLRDLEITTALADDMLDQLNQTIFRQQQQIDALARELSILRQQLPQDRNSGSQNRRDELPPHY